MTYRIRRAGLADVPVVLDLVAGATAWLAMRGSDQWQYSPRVDRIEGSAAAGELWLVDDAVGQPIATVTVDRNADPEFWDENDVPGDALYLHRLVVDRVAAGRHLGVAVLDWASRRAAAAGVRWLRLDAWASNTDLHRYYTDHGWIHVRTLTLPHRGSGALFQRPAGEQTGSGPEIVEK